MTSDISSSETEETGEKTKQQLLRLLWFSPWALILGFVLWHLSADRVRHVAARLSWDLHRHQLAVAYSQMGDVTTAPGSFPDNPHWYEELNALDDMRSDVKRLDGADDEWSKRRYIADATQCVNERTPQLTGPPPEPRIACVSLIVNNKPWLR
jgi:hypothetical protein